jgi:CheY-like chemotaxis protein
MKKILVIEDEAQTRDIYLECLEAEGFNAIGAENGRIGLQRAQEQLPDLVLCDIMMPELDRLQRPNHAAPKPYHSNYSSHFSHV